MIKIELSFNIYFCLRLKKKLAKVGGKSRKIDSFGPN